MFNDFALITQFQWRFFANLAPKSPHDSIPFLIYDLKLGPGCAGR